jgi:chaperonin GroES
MSELIQPLGARVLVRVLAQESVTASGLYVPDTAREKPQRGDVVAIGTDTDLIKVTVGDRVLFPKYTGTEVRLDDEDHLVIESADLLAIVGRSTPAGAA